MSKADLVDPALSVVIPCYNEEGGIAPLLDRLLPACQASFGRCFEIILIDDGSKDLTWTEILSAADRIPNVARNRISK